ncbi:hypothetical protein [Actinomadura verrucosospora]|nr:hypothetical protein [Actinomadura verrucosospora]
MAWILVAVLVGTSGCHQGGGRWKAPAPGQAAVLLNPGQGSLAERAFGDFTGTIAAGRDGSVYGLDQYLVRVTPDRRVQTVLYEDQVGQSYGGLAVLPDGSLAFGSGIVLKKVTVDQEGAVRVSVLAGATDRSRTPARAVPRTANAAAHHFRGVPLPLGVRPDGSLVIGDGDVVWALAKERLTRLYRLRKPYRAATNPRLVETAMDAKGTVYLTTYYDAPKNRPAAPSPRISDVITIRADGTVGRLAPPARSAGIAGVLTSMPVDTMAGDGADGLYILTGDDHATYVVHVHAGTAEVVARHVNGNRSGCRMPSHPVDAMNLPCDLPWNMAASRPGSLVMAGNGGGREGTDSILQIAAK